MRVRRNLTSLDDPLTVAVAEDKPLVYRLLAERGIPVPRYILCAADDLETAWTFVESLGRPCVVKPAHASGALGVTTAISTRFDLARAMAYGGAFGRELLVEELVEGGVYRLLYFDGELLDAVLRTPPTVQGDGSASVEQLISAENRRRLAGGIEACQSLVKIDQELRHTLRQRGYTLRSVPPARTTRFVSRTPSTTTAAKTTYRPPKPFAARSSRRAPPQRRRSVFVSPGSTSSLATPACRWPRRRRGHRGQPCARALLPLLQARGTRAGGFDRAGAARGGEVVNQPPVILVGANMVTVVPIIRSLGKAGVDVRLLCSPNAAPSYSRYARRLPTDGPGPQPELWLRYLLGRAAENLRGAVVLACNDDALELLLDHREALAERYVLDVCDVAAQRAMLDKLATYRLPPRPGCRRRASGLPGPRKRCWSTPTNTPGH